MHLQIIRGQWRHPFSHFQPNTFENIGSLLDYPHKCNKNLTQSCSVAAGPANRKRISTTVMSEPRESKCWAFFIDPRALPLGFSDRGMNPCCMGLPYGLPNFCASASYTKDKESFALHSSHDYWLAQGMHEAPALQNRIFHRQLPSNCTIS